MDRSLRVYRRKARSGVPISTGNYICCAEVKKRLGEGVVVRPARKNESESSTDPPVPGLPTEEPFSHKLFLDESVNSFFRRICWSPCGKLFFAPTGTFMQTATSTPVDCTYIFSRDSMTVPIAYVPCPSKPSIIVRCNPVLFQLREVGTAANLLSLGYRIVFAVATVDSVLVYDTQHLAPMVVLKDIHYASLSDIAWTSDGMRLGVSSTDGFCSFAQFEQSDLGVPLEGTELSSAMQKVIEARQPPTQKHAEEDSAGVSKSFEDAEAEERQPAKRKEASSSIAAELESPSKKPKVESAFSEQSPVMATTASVNKKRITPIMMAVLPDIVVPSFPEPAPQDSK